MASSLDWTGRPTLVTGAGGFIGSTVVENLVRAGAQVRAFIRYNSRNDFGSLELCGADVLDEVEVFTGDLANPEAVSGAVEGSEIVLHLGALIPIPYSYRHPREYEVANVVGTLNVLQAVRAADVKRLVHVSSSEVYGTARTAPITEEHPLNAQSPYAATKTAADQLAISYWHSFETPVVVARPFNTYGPRQSARAVIPAIVTQALSRDVIELGATSPTRDFLYVEDTAAGLARCAIVDGVEGETYNLGTGTEISIAEVVEHVLRSVGRDLPVVERDQRLRPDSSEVERLVADSSKARSALGWAPQVSFDDGLQRTIEWIRASLDRYKTTIYNV
ncbi:MAG TPA: GDP-mannose 4,6-dehydratase [Gaiellaceae bacterium]|jgi:dTDP-glucose 4,6-dehydratase